jgi:DNA mismatch endonuclease (patch repair protein)
MDVHSPSQRSYNMSRIRSKNTRPEEIIRKLLWSHGYRYRLHSKDLPGKPDIVFAGRKKLLFIHGCFWHRHDCRYFKWPKTNVDFWKQKIEDNIERDSKNYDILSQSGWRYLVIWECETKVKSFDELWNKLDTFLTS